MRIISLLILLAIIFAGWFYYKNGRLPESTADIKSGLPVVSVEDKSTTVNVPTGIETEERQVDYPSVNVEQRGEQR